jgi:hypothetical protein
MNKLNKSDYERFTNNHSLIYFHDDENNIDIIHAKDIDEVKLEELKKIARGIVPL